MRQRQLLPRSRRPRRWQPTSRPRSTSGVSQLTMYAPATPASHKLALQPCPCHTPPKLKLALSQLMHCWFTTKAPLPFILCSKLGEVWAQFIPAACMHTTDVCLCRGLTGPHRPSHHAHCIISCSSNPCFCHCCPLVCAST